jgi:UDP-N-acetylmuramoylalanine--D-glutamate ligase
MNISGKKISIIGAGRSGIGAAKLVQKLDAVPFVSDNSADKFIQSSVEILKPLNIDYEIGGHTRKVFDCDLMVISPGVPSDAEVIKSAAQRKIKIISEIELAYHFCKGKIIAITGTNGKTTTTSLCGHVFNLCGAKTYAAGNIGNAFSEIALDVEEDEFVSLEVSSFQLDFIEEFKPNAAIILNITPDHLNRYDNDFNNYINSKMRIYMNQDDSDYLILNKDDDVVNQFAKNYKAKDYFFALREKTDYGCSEEDGRIYFAESGKIQFECLVSDINLQGSHNISNAMAVICAAKLFGLNNDKIKHALKTFKAVEHRLEFVREIEGVKYFNDSKATNVESVWYALSSFDSPVFLILGGQDKGNDYNRIKNLVLEKVKKIYAIGSSGDKIFNFFHSHVKVEVKASLEAVVTAANNEAREGDIVLLSPACASFDMFDNYEHRGKVFKEAVNNL